MIVNKIVQRDLTNWQKKSAEAPITVIERWLIWFSRKPLQLVLLSAVKYNGASVCFDKSSGGTFVGNEGIGLPIT